MTDPEHHLDDLQRALGTGRSALHGIWTLMLGLGLALMAIASYASTDPSDDFLVAGVLVAVVLLATSHRQFASALGRSHSSRIAAASETLVYVAAVLAAAAALFVVVESR